MPLITMIYWNPSHITCFLMDADEEKENHHTRAIYEVILKSSELQPRLKWIFV